MMTMRMFIVVAAAAAVCDDENIDEDDNYCNLFCSVCDYDCDCYC